MLGYVTKITRRPWECTEDDVVKLREAGANDEQIQLTVQVTAYFNYINRVADALGVDLEPGMNESAARRGARKDAAEEGGSKSDADDSD